MCKRLYGPLNSNPCSWWESRRGKSGALHEFLNVLDAGERDYVFLAADRLATRNPGDLRAEIGLDHELLRVLDNWPGLRPVYLVIDALDASRGKSSEIRSRLDAFYY